MPENNKDSRILSRFGARELSREEYDYISGGFHTLCTGGPPPNGCPDFDCGSICPP